MKELSIVWLVMINVISFMMFAIDKFKARRNAWRIPESSLLVSMLAGGALGGFISMRLFHHKTRHWYFTFTAVISLIIWTAVYIYLYRSGLYAGGHL